MPVRFTLGLTLLLGVASGLACDLAPKEGDETYVEGWCRATNEFSDALVAAAEPAAIAASIQDYRDALDGLSPEDDVQEFHHSFLAYIDGIVADPGSLSEGDPPEPSSDVRLRLETVAASVGACDDTDLFGR